MWTRFYILLLFFNLFVSIGYTQYEAKLQLLTKDLQISGGEKKVLFFEIENKGKLLDNLSFDVLLPTGWQLITSSEVPILKPQEKHQLFVTILVDKRASQSTFRIECTLKRGYQPLAIKDVALTLIRKFNISIQPIEVPEFVKSGQSYKQRFLVQNTGNTTEKVVFSSTFGNISKDISTTIPPYKSIEKEVEILIPTHSTENQYTSVDIQVKPVNRDTTITHILSLPIFSNTVKRNDPYLRFPIEISTIYNRFDSPFQKAQAFQFDVRGKGFLDFKKNHQFEFIAHGPNRFNFPRFGNFDQYYAQYSYKKIKIGVGDNLYQISNLLERNRFGRGAEITVQMGKSEARAFAFQSRFYPQIKDEIGGQYILQFQNKGNLSFNYINKRHSVKDISLRSNLGSAAYFFQNNKFWVESEVGVSQTTQNISIGVYNYVYASINKFSLNSNLVYSGKDFYGFYTNSLLINNGLRYQLSKKLSLQLSQNYNNLNPAYDTFMYITVPIYKSISPEINYRFSNTESLNLSYIIREREDRQTPKTFHFSENLIRGLYTKTKGFLLLTIDGDIGKTKNLMAVIDTDSLTNLYRLRVQPAFNFSKNLQGGFYGEYLKTSRYSTQNTVNNLWFYGLNFSYNLKNKAEISLFYRNNYAPDELFQSQSFFDTRASVNIKNHSLILFSSYGYFPAPLNQTNFFASLTYRYTLNIPLKKRKDLGNVQGMVYRRNLSDHSGFIVSMDGQSVTTAKDGRFSFQNIVPGSYFLEVKKSSMKFGEMIEKGEAIKVDLKPTESKIVKLEVIKSGKITGTIDGIKQKSLKENLLIKIVNGDYSKITTSNASGGFTFSELKPGTYRIELIDTRLNGIYQHINSGELCVVKAGQESKFVVKTVPFKKKIEFQTDSFSFENK